MTDTAPPGEFWADAIKGLRGDPVARLRMARKNMPVPAAFREAAVAMRAMIRDSRKMGEDTENLLRLLYVTAAQHDFLHHTPYIEGIGPGYNVAERIPRKVWTALDFPYAEIGYRHLEILTKTDVKWVVGAWGEPLQHQSAQEKHNRVWMEYVSRTKREFAESDQRFRTELEGLLSSAPTPTRGRKRGWLGWLFGRG